MFYPRWTREELLLRLEEGLKALEKEVPLLEAWLFGSWARGRASVGSDVDLLLLYQGGYRPGGWRLEEALLVLSAFTLLQGLGSTLLAPNLNKIVEHVQQGTLDFVLLKPIDPQFWLSFRAFSPWGLGDFLLGMGLLLYAGARLGLGLGGCGCAHHWHQPRHDRCR